MTNELEKKFFDTFGIEPIEIPSREYDSDGEICSYYVEYPQITDRILLELICIANQYEDYSQTTNMKNIKARTLRILLRNEKFYKNFYENDKRYKKFKHQVQALFEEG